MNWKIKTKEEIVRIHDFDEHFMNPRRALKKISVEIVCIPHASQSFFIQFSRLWKTDWNLFSSSFQTTISIDFYIAHTNIYAQYFTITQIRWQYKICDEIYN